jgi:hypothetical protein
MTIEDFLEVLIDGCVFRGRYRFVVGDDDAPPRIPVNSV